MIRSRLLPASQRQSRPLRKLVVHKLPGERLPDLYGVVMGALKPWHLLIMLFCLIVVAGGAAGVVAIIRATNKKDR